MSNLTLSRQAARELDRQAVERYGFSSLVLMENAGRSCAETLAKRTEGPVVVFCGKGNNAGDGFVIARHLDLLGIDVRIVSLYEPHELSPDASVNARIAAQAGLAARQWTAAPDSQIEEDVAHCEWAVDALLGTGARGQTRNPIAGAIQFLNDRAKNVLAIDLPSGLDADTGAAADQTIRATLTCTFVAPKKGFPHVARTRVPRRGPRVGNRRAAPPRRRDRSAVPARRALAR